MKKWLLDLRVHTADLFMLPARDILLLVRNKSRKHALVFLNQCIELF